MFIIRKIGKTLRGQAKPYQIISASILGALIGFAPPFSNAPLYLIGVVMILAVLNANFFIATATAGLCKLLAMLLMPVSFELGLILVDGPLQPIFRFLINAPVTALMGFDYYVTAGGSLLAVILGTALGIGYIKLITNFRKKMADVEANSEKYADFVSKRSVRILMWVLFGGKAKASYAELTELKKIGNPVRPLGIAFALLVIVLLFIVQQFASGPLITTLLRGQLEQFHGATVDVEGVELDLASGKLSVQRLAMADPDNLETDLIRANELTAQISSTDLLRKRFTIDNIVVDDPVQGEKRDKPGVLIGNRPAPSPPSEEGQSLEDLFKQAKTWKERLDTLRQWLERLQGPSDDKQASDDSVRDRLRKFADQYGHAQVRAAHLVEGAPTVLIRDIKINKLRATWPKDETLDIHGTNLSTQPALAPDKPNITIKSSNETFDLALAIAPAAMANETSNLKFELRNQSVDATMADLDLNDIAKFSGGTWRVGMDGQWDTANLDLPVTFEIQGTDLTIPKINKTLKDQSLPLSFQVLGPMDTPRLKLDADKLIDTTLAIAKKELGSAAVDALQGALKKELGEDVTKKIGDLTKGLLPGSKKNDQEGEEDNADDKEPEPEAEPEESAGDKLKKLIPGGF